MRLLVLALLVAGCAHKPQTGVLVLRLSPASARVLLDESYIGSAAQLSGHRLKINAGHRRVEVSADGHYAQHRDAEVPVNGNVELDVQLHAIPDGARGD